MSTIASTLGSEAERVGSGVTRWQDAALKGNRKPAISEAQRRVREAEDLIEARTGELGTYLTRQFMEPMTEQRAAEYAQVIAEIEQEIAGAERALTRHRMVLEGVTAGT